MRACVVDRIAASSAETITPAAAPRRARSETSTAGTAGRRVIPGTPCPPPPSRRTRASLSMPCLAVAVMAVLMASLTAAAAVRPGIPLGRASSSAAPGFVRGASSLGTAAGVVLRTTTARPAAPLAPGAGGQRGGAFSLSLGGNHAPPFGRRCLCLLSSSSSSSSQSPPSHPPPSPPSLATLAPGARYEAEVVVKRSRFVAYAQHVVDWTEARAVIDGCRQDHPKARHWCHAYRGVIVAASHSPSDEEEGEGGSRADVTVTTERCDDDGEPSGTAGQPILAALQQHQQRVNDGNGNGIDGLVDVVCVVVRYFGGTKLGAGGLIRAYGGAAREVLRVAPVVVVAAPWVTFVVRRRTGSASGGGGGISAAVYGCVARVGGTVSDETFDDTDGTLSSLTVTCDNASVGDMLRAALLDATRGGVEFFGPPA